MGSGASYLVGYLLILPASCVWQSNTPADDIVASGAHAQAGALVSLVSFLVDDDRLHDAAGVARLAAIRCTTSECRAKAFVLGGQALLLARDPHSAAVCFTQALAANSLWDEPAERARILFCLGMASQEANRPRLCATYLYQARATAKLKSIPNAVYIDPRCVTPELGLAASRFDKVDDLMERVIAASMNYSNRLDAALAESSDDAGGPPLPAFLPEEARQLWRRGSGGEAWNDSLLARIRLGQDAPAELASDVFRKWGAVSLGNMVSETICSTLEAWFAQVVSANSTMFPESGKRLATHVGDVPALRDFVLPALSDAGGLLGTVVATVLDHAGVLLDDQFASAGVLVGLGSAAVYGGAPTGPIRRASGAFSESHIRRMKDTNANGAEGIVILIFLTDVEYRAGGLEVWPGAHTLDWNASSWDVLTFEDVNEDGWPYTTASLQLAASRGECFLLHPGIPSRHGVYSWDLEDGLPSVLPTARWLEITLLPRQHVDVIDEMQRDSRFRLHPELRMHLPTYPPLHGIGVDDQVLASSPTATDGPPFSVPVETVEARLAVAQRFGVKGASNIAESLGWQPAGRRPGQLERAKVTGDASGILGEML